MTVAETMHDSVQGKVSKFKLSGGEANKWEVTLSTAADVLGQNTFTGTAKGTKTDTGAWNGAFHGDGAAVADDSTGSAAPPLVLVGEFDANFANGSVAGGFGARYKK